MVKSNLLPSMGKVTWRFVVRIIFTIMGAAVSYPSDQLLSKRKSLSRLAARRRRRSIRPVIAAILVWVIGGAPVYATSPCWQWRGSEAAFGVVGPYENNPNAAANDVVAYCDANVMTCIENNSTAPCGAGYYTYSCSDFALVGSLVYQPFPYTNSLDISYQSTNLQTGVITTGYLGGHTPVVTPNAYANPNGCEVYVQVPAPVKAQQGPTCNCVNDPINPASGGMYLIENDIEDPSAELKFRRYYNSTDSTNSNNLSTGWRHSFSSFIAPRYAGTSYNGPYVVATYNSSLYTTEAAACTSGFPQIQSQVNSWAGATASYSNGVCTLSIGTNQIGTLPLLYSSYPTPNPSSQQLVGYDVTRDDGKVISFVLNGTALVAPPGVSLRLQTGSGFTLTDDADNVESYNSNGVLQSIVSRSGIVQTLGYNANGQLATITNSFGNALALSYNGAGTLTSVTDPNSNSVQYAYDNSERLGTVTNLDSTTRSYQYNNTSFPMLVTGLVDETGTTYATWSYDSQGRANGTSEAGGANAASLTYNSNSSVTVTDALGAVRTFSYGRYGDQSLVTGISGSQCPTCQESAATTYDSAGWVSSRTDYNGNLTCYANDDVRGLELVRVEGFAPGTSCPANLTTYTTVSGTLQRKITTQWSSTWREPQTITEPNRTTSFTFDSYGNVLTKTITDTSVTPNVSRTWTYEYYNSGLYGQVNTLTGPRTDITTDVTTYTYYNCTTGGKCGQIDTITNGFGQVTTFDTYNAYGLPLTITDANGVVMTLTYDTRARLTSREISAETTGYSHYPTGLLKTVTLPDSSTLTYSYDTAHRLNKITDGPGNYISYVRDAMSNVTGASSYDPTGALHRTHTRAFNTLSELYQDINSAGTSAVTTTYGYDSNGNPTSIDAPLSRNTGNQFDALNRLSEITDPNSGITKLAYDANDNLASIIDPRTLTTSYTHDGFNEVTKLVSPDTGTSTKTYDSAGNLKTTTDARSALATYTYDALNRVTQVAYSDQTINLTYDAGTNGKGRLTGASDANHSMSWTYDALGRVDGKGQTVAGVTKSVGYSYTNGDLITLVTPSGQTVTYTYTNHRITAIKVNSTTLLSGVTYDPFGPATGWTWGNATTVSRSYTEDGAQNQIVTAGVTNGYTEDNALRITGISDSGLSGNTWTFGYDLLDRVTSGSSSALARGYTFDANSNMLTETGTVDYTASISATNNQIGSTTGAIVRSYGYDNAGNTTSYTGATFTFNQRGRMSSATVSAGTTNYVYNALSQLIEKSGNGGTTLLMYDESGHILGEYSSSGALIEETIWMGDLPVAVLQPNGGSISIYYIHSDHLGTPRKITQPSTNTLAWRWDPDTFGSLAPNQNPGGLGTFVYNLRYPGQYALTETGLFYNYFRDYDPQTGRYVESDPIGLMGGSYSTYAYANVNPISLIDPTGLQSPFGGPSYSPAVAQGLATQQQLAVFQGQAASAALQQVLPTSTGTTVTIPVGVVPVGAVVVPVVMSLRYKNQSSGSSCTIGVGIGTGLSASTRVSGTYGNSGGDLSGWGLTSSSSTRPVFGNLGYTATSTLYLNGSYSFSQGPATVGGSMSASYTFGYTFNW